MHKRRLLKLAALLEADAKNKKGIKFDMGAWGYVQAPDKPISCRTTACAMGLAALSGAFKRQGLGYKIKRSVGGFNNLVVTMHGRGWGIPSAMKLFAISRPDAIHLFVALVDLEGARGERAVAKSIRDFVTDKAAP